MGIQAGTIWCRSNCQRGGALGNNGKALEVFSGLRTTPRIGTNSATRNVSSKPTTASSATPGSHSSV